MVRKQFRTQCGPPPDDDGLTGLQAQAIARLIANQLWQNDGNRRRFITGQSDINERLNKTNANLASGISHLAGQNISLNKKVDFLISLCEAVMATANANQRDVDKLRQAFIEADLVVIPPGERFHREEEVA